MRRTPNFKRYFLLANRTTTPGTRQYIHIATCIVPSIKTVFSPQCTSSRRLPSSARAYSGLPRSGSLHPHRRHPRGLSRGLEPEERSDVPFLIASRMRSSPSTKICTYAETLFLCNRAAVGGYIVHQRLASPNSAHRSSCAY